MADFLRSQLDFILFFYGLAFILLGAVGFSIARSGPHAVPWHLLGLFGVVHGCGEWLDLLALSTGDSATFAVVRTAVMTMSYAVLVEFARLGFERTGARIVGRWILIVLIVPVVVLAGTHGSVAANASARYLLGVTGAEGSAWLLLSMAGNQRGTERRWTVVAAIALALYGVAAGAIVPAAPFWPANVLNHEVFIHATGIPIQLVRGILACGLAVSLWRLWNERLITSATSVAYSAHLRRQFARTFAALATIFVGGWGLTQYLGDISNAKIGESAATDIHVLASRFRTEFAVVDAIASVMSIAAQIQAAASKGDPADTAAARTVLDRGLRSSGSSSAILRNVSGTTVIMVGENPACGGNSTSLDGSGFCRAGSYEIYYAAASVPGNDGRPAGTLVLFRSLRATQNELEKYAHPYFLADDRARVVASNQAGVLARPLWQDSGPTAASAATVAADRASAVPLFHQPLKNDGWTSYEGARAYVQRYDDASGRWSLTLLSLPVNVFASRFLGIVLTLLTATLTLLHLAGTEHLMRDNIQLLDKLALEERTRSLEVQATTDPLTGIANRLKFNQILAVEVALATARRTPLSLVFFDIDNFKKINDTQGHAAGDQVLIQIASIAESVVRETDLLARWGGEEFVILARHSSVERAALLAERLRAAIATHSFDGLCTITCSFGVTEFRIADTDTVLLARADSALYVAKAKGRDRVELT